MVRLLSGIFVGVLFLVSCSENTKTSEVSSPNQTKPASSEKHETPPLPVPSANINQAFLGVYLPTEYIDRLNSTKNHSASMRETRKDVYDVLDVEPDKVYYNIKWHDQAALSDDQVKSVNFLDTENKKILQDSNGNQYQKISDSGNYHESVRNYVASIVLKGLGDGSRIKSVGQKLEVNGERFVINLDDMFFPKDDNLLLHGENDGKDVGLVISDVKYSFFLLEPDPSDEEGMHFRNSVKIFYEENR